MEATKKEQPTTLILSRRAVLTGISGIVSGSGFAAATILGGNSAFVARLESEVGGRIGFAALDTANEHRLSYRADERFAMCSTFKLMLAAAILSRIDSGSLSFAQPVSFTRADILPTSPIAEAHPNGGAEPLSRMLELLTTASDNTAANRLLELIGGPAGYTAYLRTIGDRVTRLDRVELDLNSNIAGDPRDTTTANAMVANMRRALLGSHLSRVSRQRLQRWMRDCQTGHGRLRARLPDRWEAGDKTGTGAGGSVNDLAIFFPPNKHPILIACYMSRSAASTEILNEAHARIGSWVALTCQHA